MNKLRLQLLEILHENKGKYISGEKISTELGVSRAAIWKHIKELRKKGYKINSRSKRGYILLIVVSGFSNFTTWF
jgi:BirA family biotin operon repressor/biotin-[acetyl-CoA-carboxylase] ligase